MTSFTTFDDFATDIRDQLTDLWDDMQQALGVMADVLNSAADKFDWGYLISPLGKAIIDGLTTDDVEKAIDKFNNEIRPQIEDKINEVTEDIGHVVSEMFGDPIGLKQLSFDYADCKEKLVYPAPSIASEIKSLGNHWQGNAYNNYSQAALEQVKAMQDLALGLEQASTMTNLAAQKLLQLWVDLADKLIGGITSVISLAADATSVEKILSFEVPVVIDAIAKLLAFAQEVAKILEDYMIGVGFPDQLKWEQLLNGTLGLPQNQWPVMHPDAIDGVATPGQWQPR